jgi:hypothetical protein
MQFIYVLVRCSTYCIIYRYSVHGSKDYKSHITQAVQRAYLQLKTFVKFIKNIDFVEICTDVEVKAGGQKVDSYPSAVSGLLTSLFSKARMARVS